MAIPSFVFYGLKLVGPEKFRDRAYVESYWFLFKLLLLKELKVRYTGTILGYLWAVANPLLFGLVYFFAFGIIMRIEVENYASFLLTGLFPWLMISNSINGGSSSLMTNANIVNNTATRRSLFPTICVASELVHLFMSLPVLLVLIYLDRQELAFINPLGLIVVSLLTYTFALPIAVMLSAVTCYFRDLEYLIALFLQLFFFLTPIVYPLEIVPETFHQLYSLNPVGLIIVEWRHVLLGETLNYQNLINILIVNSILVAVCIRIWKRTIPTVSDVL